MERNCQFGSKNLAASLNEVKKDTNILCPNLWTKRDDHLINDTHLSVHFDLQVEIWLANEQAQYEAACTGYVMTDSIGYYRFTTLVPPTYASRPRHIHFRVTSQNPSLEV